MDSHDSYDPIPKSSSAAADIQMKVMIDVSNDDETASLPPHILEPKTTLPKNKEDGWLSNIPDRSKGILLCVVGILILSPDAYMLRLSAKNLPGYTVLFSKYMISVLVFLSLLLVQTKFNLKLSYEKLKSIGWWGLLAGFILGVSYVFFTLAIQMGIVANVLVIVASNPIYTAIIGYYAYHETMNLRTAITFLFCFGAILLVFISDLKSNSPPIGNWLALAAAVTLGMYFSLLRYIALKVGGEPDMVPCNMIAGLTVGIIALIIGGLPVMCGALDGLYLLIQGIFTVSLSFAMITMGPSYISATEVSLYMFIETILGPVWVYLGGYEVPPKLTIYGGIILIVSLGANSLLSLRDEDKLTTSTSGDNDGVVAASSSADDVKGDGDGVDKDDDDCVAASTDYDSVAIDCVTVDAS